MNLSWRPLKLADIDACARLPLLDESAYDAETRARLPDLWRHLLTTRTMESGVFEDGDRPVGKRLLGFALIVFLEDQFVSDAVTRQPPYINRQIVDQWIAGRSPILNMAAIRRANSGRGLNQHVFHEAFPEVDSAGFSPIIEKVLEMFLQCTAGYRLKSSTIEVYGQTQLQVNMNGGYRLRTDYRRADGLTPHASPPAKEPYLVGMNREESGISIGSAMSMLFRYTPPRFCFKPGEQEMLAHALWGQSDDDLADSMHLAVATVRKRWLTVYERVLAVSPEMFAPEENGPSPERTRGAEKRRVLLTYLRSHFEELRPIDRKIGL